MFFNGTMFLHALWVGFTYACIAFGALAYRQVSDNLMHKEIRLGEVRKELFDNRVILSLSLMILAIIVCAYIATRTKPNPTSPVDLLKYVVPIAITINVVQVYLRAKWQRISIRTQGIVIKYLFNERADILPFNEIIYTAIEYHQLGATIECISHQNQSPVHMHLTRWGAEEIRNAITKYSESELHIVEKKSKTKTT